MELRKPHPESSTTSLTWAPLHVSSGRARRSLLSRRQASALALDPNDEAAAIQEREARRTEQVEIDDLMDDIEAEIASEIDPFWHYRTKSEAPPPLTPWMRMTEEEKARVRAARRPALHVVPSAPSASAPESIRRAA